MPEFYSFQDHSDVRQTQLENLIIDENKKIIRQSGSVELSKSIKVPSGYTYQIAAGSKVILKNGAFIYSEAPISAIGTQENPIIFEGGDNLGGGILVAGSDGQSRFQYVEFKSLGNLKPNDGGFLITSALTFTKQTLSLKTHHLRTT